VAFLGSTPIGGPIVGAVSQWFGARAGLVLGGVAAVLTGIWALVALRRRVAAGQATGQVPVVAAS
jgi:hypothetical protein